MTPLAGLSVPVLQEGALLSPWVLAIIAVVLIVLFIWLLLRWQAKKAAAPAETAKPAAAAPQPAAPVVEAAPVKIATPVAVKPPDDLEIIEGIGPKICAVLQQAGVTTFAQLAGMDPQKITEIMQAAGIRLGDPRSWPEQARLAAAGDMEGLKALQDSLKGGRVVA